jgi:hypothetical protein
MNEFLIREGYNLEKTDELVNKLQAKLTFEQISALGDSVKTIIGILGYCYKVYGSIVSAYKSFYDNAKSFMSDVIPATVNQIYDFADKFITTMDESYDTGGAYAPFDKYTYTTLMLEGDMAEQISISIKENFYDQFSIYIPQKYLWRNSSPLHVRTMNIEEDRLIIKRTANALMSLDGSDINSLFKQFQIIHGAFNVYNRFKLAQALAHDIQRNPMPFLFRVVKKNIIKNETFPAAEVLVRLIGYDEHVNIRYNNQLHTVRVKDFLDDLKVPYEIIIFRDRYDFFNFIGIDPYSDLDVFKQLTGIDVKNLADNIDKNKNKRIWIRLKDDDIMNNSQIYFQVYERKGDNIELNNMRLDNAFLQLSAFTDESILTNKEKLASLSLETRRVVLQPDIKSQYKRIKFLENSSSPVFEVLVPENFIIVMKTEAEIVNVKLTLDEYGVNSTSDLLELLGYNDLIKSSDVILKTTHVSKLSNEVNTDQLTRENKAIKVNKLSNQEVKKDIEQNTDHRLIDDYTGKGRLNDERRRVDEPNALKINENIEQYDNDDTNNVTDDNKSEK